MQILFLFFLRGSHFPTLLTLPAADVVRAELEEAAARAQMVERHNEELRAKVQVQKRVMTKAETEQEKLEQEKQKQDLYVDSLSERIKELTTNLAIAKKQREAQEKETAAAQAALREAAAEVDVSACACASLQLCDLLPCC
jgi:predicted RNase H-like nuclease (RuvC/YqgF family)